MLSRRRFVQSAAAGLLAFPLVGRGSATAETGLTLAAPLTHSDWMLKPGIAWGEPGVRHMLDQCKACGWSNVLWRAFDAGQSTYPSKLLKPASHPTTDNIFNVQTEADRASLKKLPPNLTPEQGAGYLAKLKQIDYGRFDSLGYAIEYGHSIGLKIWAWATINEDDHGWGWASEFSIAHPGFRWRRRDGSFCRSQLSFAFPEVRRYKIELIDELLTYRIDGLFLDWIRTGDIRDNPQTDADGVADSGYESPNVEAMKAKHDVSPHAVPSDDDRWVRVRAEPQTIFMREVRQRVKLPLCVMVGHPWHYRGAIDKIDGNLRGLLLDVKTWADEGLMDSVVAAGYYRDGGSPEMAFKALRVETGGKADVWSYAWVPQSVADFERDAALSESVGAKTMLLWEADYIDDRSNAAELKKAMSAKARM